MFRKILLYGAILAVLSLALQLIEYRMVILDHAIQLYGGVIAGLFTILGIIAGRKLTRPKEKIIEVKTLITQGATENMSVSGAAEKLNISQREYEILQLMGKGLSNQEIADQIFVSINTVKSHVSNILLKLDAKRRTQAVIKAREMNILS
jgi:two-component system, NarL family, response regulator LiaR